METCNNCKQEVSRYKEKSGMSICCDSCYPLTEIDIREEELLLDIVEQCSEMNSIYFKNKFKGNKITFDF